MATPIISADSHVAEPEEAYRDIDPKYKDRAPRLVHDDETGAGLLVDGIPKPIPMSFICAAGRKPEDVVVRNSSAVVVTDAPDRVYAGTAANAAFYIARMGDFYY